MHLQVRAFSLTPNRHSICFSTLVESVHLVRTVIASTLMGRTDFSQIANYS